MNRGEAQDEYVWHHLSADAFIAWLYYLENIKFLGVIKTTQFVALYFKSVEKVSNLEHKTERIHVLPLIQKKESYMVAGVPPRRSQLWTLLSSDKVINDIRLGE